jgi:hypothetical protein
MSPNEMTTRRLFSLARSGSSVGVIFLESVFHILHCKFRSEDDCSSISGLMTVDGCVVFVVVAENARVAYFKMRKSPDSVEPRGCREGSERIHEKEDARHERIAIILAVSITNLSVRQSMNQFDHFLSFVCFIVRLRSHNFEQLLNIERKCFDAVPFRIADCGDKRTQKMWGRVVYT